MSYENNAFSGIGAGYGSNPVSGIIGAVIGACLGVVIWVVIYHLGFIAAIGGYAIAAGAMKGYEMLGGSLDVKGICLSILVSLLMVFVANYVSWVVECHIALNEFEPWTMSEVFEYLPNILKEFDLVKDFLSDLVVGYILSIIGAFSMVSKKLKSVD